MSNNKQSMKLYTEEQLTKYLLDEGIMELSDLANNLIPYIELPSDEEIEKMRKEYIEHVNTSIHKRCTTNLCHLGWYLVGKVW